MTRINPPPLPNYVMEDKIDARQQIDDVFGTHDISRGKDSGNKTLGQDKLQVNQDYTRMDEISRSILRSAIKYNRYWVQMAKVYYTEEHWFKSSGEDGKFDFIMIKNDMIEDGIDITVEEGSNMPMNKGAQQEFVTGLVSAGMVDPLTVYEVGSGMPLPEPKKMLERLLAFQTDPVAFAGLAKTDEVNRYALMDIQVLNNGKLPKIRQDVSPEYLNYFTNYMMSADFKMKVQKNPEIQGMYTAYLTACQAVAEEKLAMLQTQMPTQEELDVQAQKALDQEALAPQQQVGPDGKPVQQNPQQSPGDQMSKQAPVAQPTQV
jgi:hypothetical protein